MDVSNHLIIVQPISIISSSALISLTHLTTNFSIKELKLECLELMKVMEESILGEEDSMEKMKMDWAQIP